VNRLKSTPWLSSNVKNVLVDKMQSLRGEFLGSNIYQDEKLLEERYRGVSN